MATGAELPPDAPAPRLCTIVKWPDFDGYGFNLHAEKSKPGQFIGKVDDCSPAQAAGLLPGDRILEVNGVNIANENHKQVVERIKAVLNETRLLVVDDAADKWYRDKKIVVKGTQANVRRLEAPPVRPRSPADEEDDDEEGEEEQPPLPPPQQQKQQPEEAGGEEEEEEEEDDDNSSFKSFTEQDTSKTASANDSKNSTPSSEKRSITKTDRSDSPKDCPKEEDEEEEEEEEEENSVPEDEVNEEIVEIASKSNDIAHPQSVSSTVDHGSTNGSAQQGTAEPADLPSSTSLPPVNNTKTTNDSLNLNMSVQEMRALLASRKRHDPKTDSIDLRQKYAIIQDM